MVVIKEIFEANSKMRFLEDLCNLVVSVYAKYEGHAAKTVGGVGFLRVTGLSKSAIAKFHLTVSCLMVETSNLANMMRNNLWGYNTSSIKFGEIFYIFFL